MGLRGAGKTSLGRRLAEQLGHAFVDVDEAIEAASGRSAAQWIRNEGIEAFRRQEAELLLAVLEAGPSGTDSRPVVLALGGGSLENLAVFERLRELRLQGQWQGIWLRASSAVLLARVQLQGGRQQRPRLVGANAAQEFCVLTARRAPRFARLADYVFDQACGTPLEAAAERLCQCLAREEILP